jgi:hypothetical protein
MLDMLEELYLWVVERIREPSTVVGVAVLLVVLNALGVSYSETQDWVITLQEQWNNALAAAAALIAMLRRG